MNDFKNYGINLRNLNINKNIKLSKEILGVNHIKTPEELKKLLGWNSYPKIYLAKFLSILINLKEDIFHGFENSKKRRIGKDFK